MCTFKLNWLVLSTLGLYLRHINTDYDYPSSWANLLVDFVLPSLRNRRWALLLVAVSSSVSSLASESARSH